MGGGTTQAALKSAPDVTLAARDGNVSVLFLRCRLPYGHLYSTTSAHFVKSFLGTPFIVLSAVAFYRAFLCSFVVWR